jgi:hypothetical protein
VWIPETAEHGWLIITRDSQIQEHLALINAVRDSNARMVALVGTDAKGTWEQLEVVMTNWRRIEGLLDEPGPFIYALTRTGGLRRIDLDAAADRASRPRRRRGPQRPGRETKGSTLF